LRWLTASSQCSGRVDFAELKVICEPLGVGLLKFVKRFEGER
jgi:hypothetical protein